MFTNQFSQFSSLAEDSGFTSSQIDVMASMFGNCLAALDHRGPITIDIGDQYAAAAVIQLASMPAFGETIAALNIRNDSSGPDPNDPEKVLGGVGLNLVGNLHLLGSMNVFRPLLNNLNIPVRPGIPLLKINHYDGTISYYNTNGQTIYIIDTTNEVINYYTTAGDVFYTINHTDGTVTYNTTFVFNDDPFVGKCSGVETIRLDPCNGVTFTGIPFWVKLTGGGDFITVDPSQPANSYPSNGIAVVLSGGRDMQLDCGGNIWFTCQGGNPGGIIVSDPANDDTILHEISSINIQFTGLPITVYDSSLNTIFVLDPSTGMTITDVSLTLDCGGTATVDIDPCTAITVTGIPFYVQLTGGGDFVTINPTTSLVTITGTNPIVLDPTTGVVTINGTPIGSSAQVQTYQKYASANSTNSGGEETIALNTEDAGKYGTWTATTNGVQLNATANFDIYAQVKLEVNSGLSAEISYAIRIYVNGVMKAEASTTINGATGAEATLTVHKHVAGTSGDEVLVKIEDVHDGGSSQATKLDVKGGAANTYLIVRKVS